MTTIMSNEERKGGKKESKVKKGVTYEAPQQCEPIAA